jgi:hypothetical protein
MPAAEKPIIPFASAAAFREWLKTNHGCAKCAVVFKFGAAATAVSSSSHERSYSATTLASAFSLGFSSPRHRA